jgi:type II secretory pathway pseudopilin PulG
MALLFTLTVGVILSILAVSLLGLYYGDYHSQRLQQQAIQAYWNARAGVAVNAICQLL